MYFELWIDGDRNHLAASTRRRGFGARALLIFRLAPTVGESPPTVRPIPTKPLLRVRISLHPVVGQVALYGRQPGGGVGVFTRRCAIGLIGGFLPVGLSTGWNCAVAAQPPMPRMPLEEFTQSRELVAALRKGVTAMKARKPSDPLSWFYQAAIHGVTDEKVQEALKFDPQVANVDQKKYWNQCPHSGQNSANFLPWHRAYIYYFERILRL